MKYSQDKIDELEEWLSELTLKECFLIKDNFDLIMDMLEEHGINSRPENSN